MFRGSVRINSTGAMIVASLVVFAGCGSSGVPATEEAARAALASALDAWKSGRKVEEMRGQSPEVIVRDTDWKLGRRLVGYEIGQGTFDGKSLRVPVTLTIALPSRSSRKLVAHYIVGTKPVVTVFRDGE
jgi:hypothetical protein